MRSRVCWVVGSVCLASFGAAAASVPAPDTPEGDARPALVRGAALSGTELAGRRPLYVGALGGQAFVVEREGEGLRGHPLQTSRATYKSFGLSPDGTRLAYRPLDGDIPSGDLYVEDLASGRATKLGEQLVLSAVWAPRGSGYDLAYTFSTGPDFGLAVVASGGRARVVRAAGVHPEWLAWDGSGLHYYEVVPVDWATHEQFGGVLRPRRLRLPGDEDAPAQLEDLPAGFPALRRLPPDELLSAANQEATGLEAQVQRWEREIFPGDLFAFRMLSPDGAVEVSGESLLGPGAIHFRRLADGEEHALGEGQVLRVLNEGVLVRAWDERHVSIELRPFAGQAQLVVRAHATTFTLPFTNAAVWQTGENYAGYCNSGVATHTIARGLGYAYDFNNGAGRIMAAADGLVVQIRSDVTCNSCDNSGDCTIYNAACTSPGGYGNTVIVEHADGSSTLYAHMSPQSHRVALSDAVCAGQELGAQGGTGCSAGTACGNHLHFHRQTGAAPGASQNVSFADNGNPLGCNTYASGSPLRTACGLSGSYFDNDNFSAYRFSRREPVHFDWGTGSPSPALAADTLSVAWRGFFSPRYTENLTLCTTSDDGVRVWLVNPNGLQTLIDNWTDHSPTENCVTLSGTQANAWYRVAINYYERSGGATAKLTWQSARQAREIVPMNRLAPSGLQAQYFDNVDLTNLRFTRTDPQVDFAWGTGSPHGGIQPDTFSVRWTGQVISFAAGTYTFCTLSDDGVRLWVNGVQLVNNWTDHSEQQNCGTIQLQPTVLYPITMEYYERGGGATARLLWTEPGGVQSAIPPYRLFPLNPQP